MVEKMQGERLYNLDENDWVLSHRMKSESYMKWNTWRIPIGFLDFIGFIICLLFLGLWCYNFFLILVVSFSPQVHFSMYFYFLQIFQYFVIVFLKDQIFSRNHLSVKMCG